MLLQLILHLISIDFVFNVNIIKEQGSSLYFDLVFGKGWFCDLLCVASSFVWNQIENIKSRCDVH